MTLAALIQLLAACIGIVGSLFFAIGIIRQNAAVMARLSYTYWDSNPHLPGVLAAQKADYVFGGGLIVVAFALQLASFFSTDSALVLAGNSASFAPWVALGATFAAFVALRTASMRLASYYQAGVEAVMHKQHEEDERKRRDEREAQKNAT
jgi:hypothetical protein